MNDPDRGQGILGRCCAGCCADCPAQRPPPGPAKLPRVTTSPEIERKVRQLDSDAQSIYELLDELNAGMRRVQATQLRQGSRLDQIEDRLTGVDGRLTGIDDHLTGVDGKLDTILDLLRQNRPVAG